MENGEDKKSGLFSSGIKVFWKKLPLIAKLKIIGIAALVLFLLLFLLVIIAVIRLQFLSYSDEVLANSDSDNYVELYNDYWYELCEDEDNCSEENKKLIESQKKFYERFNNICDSYDLNKKQRYILLTTLFLGYDIDEFSESKGAYTLLSEDDSEEENINPYEDEIDSIKNLAKRFNGSDNGLYNYLADSDYVDKKDNLKHYYMEFAHINDLDENLSTWSNEDKVAVRKIIISDIKTIADDYVDKTTSPIASYVPITNNTSYWWPIGSVETTEENGILFASGNPEFTYISSYYGYRVHPVTGARGSFHSGIDIPGKGNSTNVIASMNGTVINIYNSCNSYSQTSSDYSCGGGAGNYIEIQDLKGNTNIYMHLYKNSMLVNVGDTVVQGQVIAKVGSSGSSTGYHLHFTIKVNGMTVNPLDYVDSNNPRPSSSSLVDFNRTAYSKEEFNTILVNYYSQTGVCNSSSTQYLNGCNSMKNEILLRNGAEIIYDTAGNYNINPELVIARSMLEGYSPGTDYNYFGYRCYNTGGLQACQSFSSFKNGMEAYFKNVSQYDSLESMLSRYAYLGDYWYTGVHWGWGGCAYASEIYPDGVPNRVKEACSYPDGYCSVSNTSNCTPTTQDDLNAYTQYQVRRMTEVITKVFR